MMLAVMGRIKRHEDQRLLTFVHNYHRNFRHAPSLREVAAHLGVSVSTVHNRVARLRREGRVLMGGPRTLRLSDAELEDKGLLR